MQAPYFCVLFSEKVDKCESSMCSRSRQLLRKPKCFDFSESAVKEMTKRIEFFRLLAVFGPTFKTAMRGDLQSKYIVPQGGTQGKFE